MLKTTVLTTQSVKTSPNYIKLAQFLLQPLLKYPQSLSIDCEQCKNNQQIWLRVAFEEADQGRVFGRGGRNIQAIRKVLEVAALSAGQSFYLDVYESEERKSKRDNNFLGKERRIRPRSRRSPNPVKPLLKSP